jgi:hypothetical protein
MPDLFTRPAPLRPDLVLDVGEQVDSIVAMLACHRTQVFEWLPYEGGILDQVPGDENAKLEWLRGWFYEQVAERANRFRDALVANYGEKHGQAVKFCEAYEVSEYASPMDEEGRAKLWPF